VNLLDVFATFSVGSWYSKEDQVTTVHVPRVAAAARKAVRRGNVFATVLTCGLAASAVSGTIPSSAYVAENFIRDETSRPGAPATDERFATKASWLIANLSSSLALSFQEETLELARNAVQKRVDFQTTSAEDWAKSLIESARKSSA
jgi:hypothetical protein